MASRCVEPTSPRQAAEIDMSPNCLAFLDSLHTGLTPERSDATVQKAPKCKRAARRLFADSPTNVHRSRASKGPGQQAQAGPLGLDAFLCDIKARRTGMPAPMLPQEITTSTRGSRGSGLAAVGELRRALRTIDA